MSFFGKSLSDELALEKNQVSRSFFIDPYLNSPIMLVARDIILGIMKNKKMSSGSKSRKNRRGPLELQADALRDLIPNLSEYTLMEPLDYPNLYRFNWPSTLGSSLAISRDTAGGIHKDITSALELHLGSPLTCHILPPTLEHCTPWYDKWSFFDSLVTRLEAHMASPVMSSPALRETLRGENDEAMALVHLTKEIFFIDIIGKKKIIMSYDQCLMLKDIFYSRGQVFIAIEVGYPDDNQELRRMVNGTLEWHEECLSRYGNEGFGILKSTEDLCKTYLSVVVDDPLQDSFTFMIGKIVSKEIQLDCEQKEEDCLVHKFVRLLRTTKNIKIVAEVFGITKLSGHPIVDPRMGGLSAAEEARKPDVTLPSNAARISNKFCSEFLKKWLAAGNSWPKLITVSKKAESTVLYNMMMRQKRVLDPYPLEDWDHFRWSKILMYDSSDNFLQLMDDKAISFYRRDLPASWGLGEKASSKRRLLLEMLDREDVNVPKILETIMGRRVPRDWKVVAVHPKEREMKTSARLFSLLVFEMRVAFISMEHNIAASILPFMDSSTMHLSHKQIRSKFFDLTNPKVPDRMVKFFVEIDLTRWNLRWRELTIGQLGRVFNDMFGTEGLFDYSHLFFSECSVYVRVPNCPPDGIELPNPPESDLFWNNHLGGMEGLNQKQWSVATYMMIHLAMEGLNVQYTLLGQGDNQILSITRYLKPDENYLEVLHTTRRLVCERIKEECEKVGQEVRVNECVESTKVLTYSKEIRVAGVLVGLFLKFCSRLYPNSSKVFPSVHSNIGSIFSGCLVAAESCSSSLVAHYLALFHSTTYLTRIMGGRGIYGKTMKRQCDNKGIDPNYLKYLLTLPSSLGGLPILTWSDFVWKGGSDPLGKSISSLLLLARPRESSHNIYRMMLSQLNKQSLYTPKPLAESILADPTALPFRKPVTSADSVGEMTMDAITPIVKLKVVSDIMSNSMREHSETYAQVLFKMRPFNPFIAADLWAKSIVGITTEIKKMHSNTGTIQAVARSSGVDIVARLLDQEAKCLMYQFSRYQALSGNEYPTETSFEITKRLRLFWKLGNLEGITTHQPWDFKVDFSSSGFLKKGIHALVALERTDPWNTRGSQLPYMGVETQEKRAGQTFKVAGFDPLHQCLRDIQVIGEYLKNDIGTETLIRATFASLCNVDLTTINHLLGSVIGGRTSHRYPSMSLNKGTSPVNNPNFLTHVYNSCDNLYTETTRGQDHCLMLQEFMICAGWLLSSVLDRSSLSGTLRFDVDVEALPALKDEDITLPVGTLVPIKRYTQNRLCFVNTFPLRRVGHLISHPVLTCIPGVFPDQNLRGPLLEAYFRRVLRINNAGRIIAEGQHVCGAAGKLDLDEVIANGIGRLSGAIARVAAENAIAEYCATESVDRKKWNIQVYMTNIIPLMTQEVGTFFGAPGLRLDPMVRTYHLYNGPTYSGGSSRARSIFTSICTKKALRIMTSGEPESIARTTLFFTSGSKNDVSELIRIRLITGLYYCYVKGDISKEVMKKVIRNHILSATRAVESELNRIDLLTVASSYIANIPELSLHKESFDKMARGAGLKAFKHDIHESLKASRSITRNEDDLEVQRSQVTSQTFPRPLATRITCTCNYSIPGVRILINQSAPRETMDWILVCRAIGTSSYGGNSAFRFWSQFSFLFAGQHVAIVGVGNGVIASLALSAECKTVVGLDLRATLPLEPHRFISYVPPLVAAHSRTTSYSHSPLCFSSTGDWTDDVISSDFLEDLQEQTVLVLDISRGSYRFNFSLLEPIFSGDYKIRNVVIRLFVTRREALLLSIDLQMSGIKYSLYDYSLGMESGSWIWVIHYEGSIQLRTGGDCPCIDNATDSCFNGIDIPEATPQCYASALTTAVGYSYHFDEGTTLAEARRIISGRLKGISPNKDHQVVQRTWSALKLAFITLTFAELNIVDSRRILKEWSLTHECSVRDNNSKVTYYLNVSGSMIRTIAKVGGALKPIGNFEEALALL